VQLPVHCCQEALPICITRRHPWRRAEPLRQPARL